MPLVTSGVEYGNLRELCLARMRDLGLKCRDVRTREVGIQDIHHKVRPDQVLYYLFYLYYAIMYIHHIRFQLITDFFPSDLYPVYSIIIIVLIAILG